MKQIDSEVLIVGGGLNGFIAAYVLSLLKASTNINNWEENLFSDKVLKNSIGIDQIDIFFARANVLHKRKDYRKSSDYLELANNMKLAIYPSNSESVIAKTKDLLI